MFTNTTINVGFTFQKRKNFPRYIYPRYQCYLWKNICPLVKTKENCLLCKIIYKISTMRYFYAALHCYMNHSVFWTKHFFWVSPCICGMHTISPVSCVRTHTIPVCLSVSRFNRLLGVEVFSRIFEFAFDRFFVLYSRIFCMTQYYLHGS